MPRHSRFIAADSHARVYEATEEVGPLEYEAIYGCFYGRGRPYFLGFSPPMYSPGEFKGVTHEVLASPIVAYEEIYRGGLYSKRAEEWVVVRSLRTGRILHRVPTGISEGTGSENAGAGSLTTMVVKGDGAVAWIVENGARNYEVHALNKTGSPRLLASGTNIAPSSLALAGSTLYWIQGGQAFSALLH